MTDMEDDDEDSDCLLIDETKAEQPVNVNNKLNANVTQASNNNNQNITSVADSEQTFRDNIDTSPDNIVRLLKKFNYEQYCKNNPHIFNDPEEQTQQNIEKGNKHENNGGRLFCKDFARIPFDIGINLLTPDYLESPELYAHLVGNTKTSRSITDPGQSKNYEENSNSFQPATNNFTPNARRASDTLIQIPDANGTFPETPPNAVYGNAHQQTGSYTNRLNVIGNPSTSIHPNRNSYGLRSENMITGITAAQNLIGTMPNPANSSTTTRGTDVSSNLERLNGSITNNYLPPASNMHSYELAPVSRPPGQELYPSDVRRPIYDHNIAAPSGNYDSITNVCQYACCKGTRALNMSATPTLVLPGAKIPNMPLCTCPGSCNIYRTGPLYPTASPNFQVQSDFQTSAPRNPYGQPLNGIGAIQRDGFFTPEAPITYAAYQQAHLTPTRRTSFANEQPITTVMRQHTVNNTPTPAIHQTQKRDEASNEMKAYAKVTTNLINGGVINVDPSFPASSTPNHETTTSCGNIGNMIPNHVASKTIAKNNRRARSTNKSGPKVNTRRVRAPKARASMHLQLTEMNIATTQPDKPNADLQQSPMEMSIPTEHVVNKLAYNVTDANKMQIPLSHERKVRQTKTNVHNNESQQIKPLNFSKPQANEKNEKTDTAKTYPHQTECMKNNHPLVNTYIHQIILKAVDLAMQTNVQQTGEFNVTEGVQTSMSTETCTQETLKINENNSVVLSNVNKCGASADRTPKSECVVSTTSNGLGLISKEACMVRQDNGYTNVASKLAHMNKSLTSVPHISRGLTQTSNACVPNILTSTTAKDITLNNDNVAHESRIDSLNIQTDSPLDRMSLTNNKARIPVQHGNLNMNSSENTKILTNSYLLKAKKPKIHITTPNSQKNVNENTIQSAIINTTDITLPINVNQVETCLSAETVPTLTSTVACVHPTTTNFNIQSLQTPSPLNKNNLRTQITAPWDMETPIKQSNTGENQISSLLSTKKEDAVLCLDKTDIESGPNILNINPDTLMEFNIQQDNTTMIKDILQEDSIQPTRIDASTEIVRASISIETCTQPTSDNTCIKNVTKTGLTNTVIRSDTIGQHDKKDKTLDLFSVDLLKSILHNVEVNSNQENNKNNSNTMKDVLLRVEETKDHNESNEGTAAFKTNESVNEDIVISKSNNDDDHDKLNIARRRLALLNMHLKNKDRDPGEYDSIISYVLQKAACNSIQMKSLDENTCIENTVRSAADILPAKKRKILNEPEINENNDLEESINLHSRYRCRADIKRSNHQTAGKNTENNSFVPLHQYKNNNYTRNTMRSSLAVESSKTRKRKIQIHQETNENNYSGTSKKRYRYTADVKQKTNYTRPTRPVQKAGSKFHYTAVLKNQIKNKNFRKETNTTPRQCLVPLRHYGQNRFGYTNSRTTNTRNSADISSFKTRNRKDKNDTNKKRYIRGSDIKWKSHSRPVQDTAKKISTKLYQTDEDIHIKTDKKSIDTTKSTSHDEILFFNFQIEFFRRLQERLTTKGLKESADILSSEIHRLIDISDNEDAKADMMFKCPKCNNVSTYSPRMFYCKDNHTLDESDKDVHCQRCIKFRKKYINSLKRYIDGNTQIAKINDNTDTSDKNAKISDNSINSNNTLKIESTPNTNKEEIANQLKIDSEKISKTDGEMKHSNDELENKSIDRSDCTHIGEIADRPNIDYDAIEEQLNIITNGVPSLPKQAKFDIQNKHSQIKLQVKIPLDMLKLSTAEQIKLKNNTPVTNQSTFNNATNDIDDKDNFFPINREVPTKNLNSTMKNNNGNIEKNKEVKKEYPVSFENADKHESIEKRRKSFESDTNKSEEKRKSIYIYTGTYNNHDKNNHKNGEKRKTFRDDTASRLIVQAKKSIGGVQKTADVRENKSPDNHRVIKKTVKNTNCLKVCIKFKKISGEHDKVESWRTSDKEEKSYKLSDEIKDYRKNSSEIVDSASKDDNDSDVKVDKTAKSIDNSLQSLKNNYNSNGKSDLREVHILGENVKRLNEPRNYATFKDEYSYKCHVCTAMFSYRLVYRKHMSNHNIHNKPIPIDCLYKKCEICGLKIKKIAYNYHIRNDHEDVYKARIKKTNVTTSSVPTLSYCSLLPDNKKRVKK